MTAPVPPALPAGRELDVLIAEKVMGLVPCGAWRYANLGSAGGPVSMNDGCEHGKAGCYPADEGLPFGGPRRYSTDIAAAMEAVEKVCPSRWNFTCGVCLDGYWARLQDAESPEPDFHANADPREGGLALALCRVLLKAATP